MKFYNGYLIFYTYIYIYNDITFFTAINK